MADQSHTKSTLVPHSVYAAGTTSLRTAAATVIPPGCVYAAASVRAPVIVSTTSFSSGGALRSTTTITAGTGFVFGSGQTKQFAAGTYIGTGGATAAIISTGLTTIHHVFMQINKATYSAATTGMAYARPCVAHGTLGSFYPIIFKTGTIGGGGPVLNTVAGTFRWLAIGADTL